MSTLLEALTQDNLDNQREVVKEETASGTTTCLRRREMRRSPSRSPRRTVRTQHDRLDGGSRRGHPRDVQSVFRTTTANKRGLTLAGDVDAETAFAKAEQYFKPLDSGPEPADRMSPRCLRYWRAPAGDQR